MRSTSMGNLTTPEFATQKKLAKLARKYADGGKVEIVMREFKHGKLRSGSKKGPKVKDRKQAIAIALSEKRKQLAGKYAGGGSYWSQLVSEVRRLTPKSPLQEAEQKPMAGGGHAKRQR